MSKRADGPENTNEISAYMHCQLCIAEKPDNVSPKDWSRTQTGWTPRGFQVWCNRHDCNVAHIDFQGRKHPCNSTRIRVEKMN